MLLSLPLYQDSGSGPVKWTLPLPRRTMATRPPMEKKEGALLNLYDFLMKQQVFQSLHTKPPTRSCDPTPSRCIAGGAQETTHPRYTGQERKHIRAGQGSGRFLRKTESLEHCLDVSILFVLWRAYQSEYLSNIQFNINRISSFLL